MSSLDLISFAANENHVKFRSTLNEMLYSRLSEAIKEKTKDMVSEIFETEKVSDTTEIAEYVSSIIEQAEQTLGTEFTQEEIAESTSHILDLLEKAKKEDEKEEEEEEEEDKDEEEEEEEEEDEEEEEEDEEEEVEDKQEKEEDKDEKKAGKKAKQVFHFDINSHKKG
jgi:hypothetical protein